MKIVKVKLTAFTFDADAILSVTVGRLLGEAIKRSKYEQRQVMVYSEDGEVLGFLEVQE